MKKLLLIVVLLCNGAFAGELHHVCEEDAAGYVHCDYNWNG